MMADESTDRLGSQGRPENLADAISVKERDVDNYMWELEQDWAAMKEVLEENGLLTSTSRSTL